MKILHDFVEGLRMATELPFLVAFPVYLIAYGLAVFVVAKAIKAVKDLFK